MIKKLSFILLASVLLSFIPEPTKEYSAKGTIEDWQILLAHPDDVSKNQRDRVVAKFVGQLQQQISADTTKKK